jgi:O-antigen ligase
METNHTIPTAPFPLAHSRKSRSKTKSKETVRKIAFYLTVALVFIRSSQLHELITYRFNFNSYLLFVVGVPAILGLFISMSAGRPFRFPQAYLWMAFSLWIVVIIPFSIWKGGSIQLVEDYWRTNVILFVLLGGLTTTWEEFKLLLQVLAVSCVVNLVIIKAFGQLDANGRMTLPFGALANSNDYAAHLLMLLPCLLWVALTAKSIKVRIVTLGVFGYGLFAVLSSASRGALVAVSVGIVFFLFSASNKQRIWGAGLAAVMLFAVFSVMSHEAVQRMLSFSKNSSSASDEALESSDIRQHLLEDAIHSALKYPVFGLGPGNFETFEGKSKPGMWEPAHNSYATVASETGFPGFFLFLGGIAATFLTFRRIKRRFQSDERAKDLLQAAVCMQLMMVMFCLAVGFLNFSLSSHFPTMVGISIAMAYATENWQRTASPRLQVKRLDREKEKTNSKKRRRRSEPKVTATGMNLWRQDSRGNSYRKRGGSLFGRSRGGKFRAIDPTGVGTQERPFDQQKGVHGDEQRDSQTEKIDDPKTR